MAEDVNVQQTIEDQILSRAIEEPLLEHFSYTHLPNDELRRTSEGFGVLALSIVLTHERNPERSVALRKLLEGKDCAVRSMRYTMKHRAKDATTRPQDA